MTGNGALPFHEGRWRVMFGLLGGFSIAYALAELRILRLPHPQIARQVPSSWRVLFHPWVTASLYGVGLGCGIMTRIVTGALYVVVIGLVLYAHPFYATITFALFGLGRGASTIIAGWTIRGLLSREEVDPVLHQFIDFKDWVHILVGLALAMAGGYWGVSLIMLI